MEFKDYYDTLEIKRDASQDDIKRSYRKLARKYHPDVSKEADAETRFKQVGEAYEVLKDKDKRASYDQLGANWQAGQDFHPPPDWAAGSGPQGDEFSDAEFSDFFESLFGKRRQGAGQYTRGQNNFHARGSDNHARVEIELEDAYHGGNRMLTLKHAQLDEAGRQVMKERNLNVKIPKGVRQGQQIRLAKQGGFGIGEGGSGDLYLEVQFAHHPLYQVKGKDVYLDLPVTPWEAALGDTVKVPTPAGAVDLKIPANSTSGQKLRLKGRGIPAKQAGDLYAVLKVTLPPAGTEAEKQAYRAFKQTVDFNPRNKLGV